MKSDQNLFATNAPNPPHWTLNSCLCVSRSVWVHLAMFCYYTKLGAKWVELVQLMHKFVPRSRFRIFATNAPDPLHWTLNSCIGAFRSVWVHFRLFHYCMKLGAKRAELVQLMQKFLARSRIGIFRNECTRSTPLDRKLMFWCIS